MLLGYRGTVKYLETLNKDFIQKKRPLPGRDPASTLGAGEGPSGSRSYSYGLAAIWRGLGGSPGGVAPR